MVMREDTGTRRFGAKGSSRTVAEAFAGGAAHGGLQVLNAEAGGQAGAAAAAAGGCGAARGAAGAQAAAQGEGRGGPTQQRAPAGRERLLGCRPPHAAAQELRPPRWSQDCYLGW